MAMLKSGGGFNQLFWWNAQCPNAFSNFLAWLPDFKLKKRFNLNLKSSTK